MPAAVLALFGKEWLCWNAAPLRRALMSLAAGCASVCERLAQAVWTVIGASQGVVGSEVLCDGVLHHVSLGLGLSVA